MSMESNYYVIAGCDLTGIEMSDIEKCFGKVKSELVKLQEMGVITKIHTSNLCSKLLYLKNVDRG